MQVDRNVLFTQQLHIHEEHWHSMEKTTATQKRPDSEAYPEQTNRIEIYKIEK